MNVPLYQSLLPAKSGTGPAVLMRQTSIEIQYFCRVLICHATTCKMYRRRSNPLLAFGGHYKEKNLCNIDRQIGWIPALSG